MMLCNSKGDKRKDMDIPEQQWKDILYIIHVGIIRKLDSARMLIDVDKDISAGLYTYALEEFGKLIMLIGSVRTSNNTKRKVIYANEFTDHEKKFETALNYLQDNGHEYCYVLNDEGSFTSKSFTWKSFDIGLIPDFEARMSIFYSDFVYDDKQDITIQKPRNVEKNMLENAIDEFEGVIKNYNIPN